MQLYKACPSKGRTDPTELHYEVQRCSVDKRIASGIDSQERGQKVELSVLPDVRCLTVDLLLSDCNHPRSAVLEWIRRHESRIDFKCVILFAKQRQII